MLDSRHSAGVLTEYSGVPWRGSNFHIFPPPISQST